MYRDKNKGIDLITYNHLNLPTTIVFNHNLPEEKSIGYIYTANGSKLRKYTNDASKESITTDYIGAFVYENNELQFIQTAEGRLVPNENGGFHYEYALKDHLGNTRVMFDETGQVLQDQSYYPFGMSMGEELTFNMPSELPDNKYLFNGKELQSDFELGWYDYGARFYDPVLGRWQVVDPMTDSAYSWTPYRYAFNNPGKFIDPNGMFELDKKTAKANPELVIFLKNLAANFDKKSDSFKNSFYETSGLNAEQTKEMLAYGSGPTIEVENLYTEDENVNGQTINSKDQDGNIMPKNGNGLIKLDDDVVGMLKNPATMGEKIEGNTMVESTILHEGTHYGNAKVNSNSNGTYKESGKAFDVRAYGMDINRSNIKAYNQPKTIESKVLKQIK
jgi:RHS repeat-associated protein